MANNFVAGLPIIVQAFTFDQVTANGSQTVDGVVTIDGELYFVGGASAATTGVYKASDAGAWELILNSDSSTNNHFLAGQEIIALDGLTNKHVFFKANIDNAGNSLIENVQSPVKKAVEVTSNVTVTNNDSLSIYFVKSSSGDPQILITLPDLTTINDSFSLSLYIAEDNQPIQLLPHAGQQFYRNGVLVNSFNISGIGSTINLSVAQDGNLLVSGYSQSSESELGVLAIAAVADMDTANDTKAVTPSKLKGELDPVKSDITTAQGDITTLQTQVAGKIDTTEKGANNGVATLDATGRVPSSQLPTTSIEYKGSWDASTNTPTLANGSGTNGDLYVCTVAGTVNLGAGAITFNSGDQVLYNGETNEYDRVPVGSVSAETIDTDSWFTQSAFAANEYTITSASGTDPSSNYDGLRFSFAAQNANSGVANNGACTLKIGGNAVLPLRDSGRELVQGDILAGTVLSGIVAGGVAHVIKKETLIFNSKDGLLYFKNINNENLTLANITPYAGLRTAESSDITVLDDKRIIFVDGTVASLNLPKASDVPRNFCCFIFFTKEQRTVAFVPNAADQILANGSAFSANTPVNIEVAGDSGDLFRIDKFSGSGYFLTGCNKASQTISGVVKIAPPDSEAAGLVHDASNVVNKTGTQTDISGNKTFTGQIEVLKGTHNQYAGFHFVAVRLATTDATDNQYAVVADTLAGSTSDNARNYYGFSGTSETASNSTFNWTGRFVGTHGQCAHQGTGSVTGWRGTDGVLVNSGGGTMTNSSALYTAIANQNAGSTMSGCFSYVAKTPINTGTTMASIGGACIEGQNIASVTDSVDLLVGATDIPAGKHRLYVDDTIPSVIDNIAYTPAAESVYGNATSLKTALDNLNTFLKTQELMNKKLSKKK